MYVTVCPLYGPGLISSRVRVFKGIFPWLIMRGCKQKVYYDALWETLSQRLSSQ